MEKSSFKIANGLKTLNFGKQNHVTMQKLVEHFQSNLSDCWSVGVTLPHMEVVLPPENKNTLFSETFKSTYKFSFFFLILAYL